MSASSIKLSQLKKWIHIFSNADRLEAPDRDFIGHRDILIRSRARYEFVAPYVYGTLLEVGSGRGYGLEVLAPRSTVQIGVDLSRAFLKKAQCNLPAISFVQANGSTLPFTGHSFDSIIAFEVIEHVEDDVAFLNELKRLAREQGFIAISTPNKFVASGNRKKPIDPFHVREYTSPEFYTLLSHAFSSVKIFGQFERSGESISVNTLMDRIPKRWKYLVPLYIQGLISVIVRPQLRIDDCQFQTGDLDLAHTFIALCRP